MFKSRKTRDPFECAEKALEAANTAAVTVHNLYITFLLLGTYIGLIVGSTTDEQLLRVSPVTLPLLNVELPIVGFYTIIPWLLLLFHFNLLLQFGLLDEKLCQFINSINKLSLAEDREALRGRLANFSFVPMLMLSALEELSDKKKKPLLDWGSALMKGPPWVFTLIVWITVIILPLGLLLGVQIRFLPYHNSGITWGQLAAVLMDVVILAYFYPGIMSFEAVKAWWATRLCEAYKLVSPAKPINDTFRKQVKSALLIIVLSTAVVLSLGVATVAEKEPKNSNFNLDLGGKLLTDNKPPAKVINALREHKEGQTEGALQEILGINLRGRNLNYAQLTGAFLPKADLEYAQLQGATLMGASLWWAGLMGSNLQGANLSKADLRGANLMGVNLQGANLRETKLWGAIFSQKGTDLQGADLSEANLQGADLSEANLQGADLSKANLQSVNLRKAAIGGALFKAAKLDFADLRELNREMLTEKAYKELKNEVSNPKIRKTIADKLAGAIGRKDTLKEVASHQHCLSDEPKLLPNCLTEKQYTCYRLELVDYLLQKLACRDSSIAHGVAARAWQKKEKEKEKDLAEALLKANCAPVKKALEDEHLKERLRRVSESSQAAPEQPN